MKLPTIDQLTNFILMQAYNQPWYSIGPVENSKARALAVLMLATGNVAQAHPDSDDLLKRALEMGTPNAKEAPTSPPTPETTPEPKADCGRATGQIKGFDDYKEEQAILYARMEGERFGRYTKIYSLAEGGAPALADVVGRAYKSCEKLVYWSTEVAEPGKVHEALRELAFYGDLFLDKTRNDIFSYRPTTVRIRENFYLLGEGTSLGDGTRRDKHTILHACLSSGTGAAASVFETPWQHWNLALLTDKLAKTFVRAVFLSRPPSPWI